MKKKIIPAIMSVLCVIMIFQLSIAAAGTTYDWYCKRAAGHAQPRCEGNMRFIEEHGGYFVDKTHGDNNPDKVIYITFDAGYENGNIARTLDTLKEKNVPAAFFILSHLIKSQPELVARMAAEGHTVCNHTASHKDMTKLTDPAAFEAELKALEKIYKQYTGVDMASFYRPPQGRFCEENLKCANDLGYKTIFWSFAYADWDNDRQPDPDAAFKLIMDNIHNGEIMLLHPTSKTNADIIGRVIDALREQGYRFGTLEELVGG